MSNDNEVEKKTLLVPLSERLKHPFLGSFITAFVLINWRVFVVLFTGASANERIAQIEKLLHESGRDGYFWHPLFIALGYTVFLEIGNQFIQYWTHVIETVGVNIRTWHSARYEKSKDYLFEQVARVAKSAENDLRTVINTFQTKEPFGNISQIQDQIGYLRNISSTVNPSREDVLRACNEIQGQLTAALNALRTQSNDPIFVITKNTLNTAVTKLSYLARRDMVAIKGVSDQLGSRNGN